MNYSAKVNMIWQRHAEMSSRSCLRLADQTLSGTSKRYPRYLLKTIGSHFVASSPFFFVNVTLTVTSEITSMISTNSKNVYASK